MGVKVRFRGSEFRGGGGRFQEQLASMWDAIGVKIVTNVKLRGDEMAKECAEDLLQKAVALAPVGEYKRKTFGSSVEEIAEVLGSKYRVSISSKNKASDLNVQKRDSKGRFMKATEVTRDSRGRYSVDEGFLTLEGGALRRSGRVEKHQGKGNRVGWKVSFDTTRTSDRSKRTGFNYAVIQHEETDFRHKVGQAKYLEAPYLAMREEYLKRMAAEVAKGFKEGVRK